MHSLVSIGRCFVNLPPSAPQYNADTTCAAPRTGASDLETQCHMFLRHGLATSTQKTYVSVQRSFLQFCELENRLNSNRSPLPSNEWTLCLFATWLANILTAIYRCLDYSVYDDVLFWTACCLAYFGFLRSSEFTVPHSDAYTPALHLSHENVAFDRRVNPSSIQVTPSVENGPISARLCPHVGTGASSLVSSRIVAQLLGYPGRFRWSSVRSFQRRPFNPCGLHRAPASVVSTGWYSWSLWQSQFSYWGGDYSRFSWRP